MSFPNQRAFDALQSTLEDMYQQREQCLKRLIIYRDDHPKFFIPTMEGFTPEVVDLKMPTFDPRDVEELLRLPEPKRAAKWLQMGFVACDEQLSSPSLFWKEYKAMFGPLLQEESATIDESQQEKPSADGAQAHAPGNEPLISSHKFFLTLFRAIHGVRLYGSGDDSIGQVVVRGIRARSVALTFSSTNRARSLRQLRWYKEQDEVSKPKSLFAKNLAEDPLFMTAAKHDRKKSPDGEKTENMGFPGVALRKRDKMLDQAWSAPERLFECVGLAESGGLKSDGGMTIWAAQRAVHEMMEEAAASGKGRPGGTNKARQQAHPSESPSSGFPTVVAKKGAAPKAPHALERITGAHPVVLIYQLLASSDKNALESTKNDKT